LQNNLHFIAASHLDAATMHITYQLKIFCTAVLSKYVLGKKFSTTQWFALYSLMSGVVLVQLSKDEGGKRAMV